MLSWPPTSLWIACWVDAPSVAVVATPLAASDAASWIGSQISIGRSLSS
jgi:hypothetical protein